MSDKLRIDIVLENEELIAVAKPPGLATAPERNPEALDVLTWLRRRYPGDVTTKPMLVHRIDKMASGVVVFAKGIEAKRELSESFRKRRVVKDYLAIVVGRFPEAPFREASRIAPRPDNDKLMQVAKRGKHSLTLLRRIALVRGHSLVHARPVTGRTHQIRVHLAHVGFPIAGDTLYGGQPEIRLSEWKDRYQPSARKPERPLLERLALHAFRVVIERPSGLLVISTPPPKDFRATLDQLEKLDFGGAGRDDKTRWQETLDFGADDPFAELESSEPRDAEASSGDEGEDERV
jgi:RluA family pseudouridine synthase